MNIVAIGHLLEQTVLSCGGILLKNIENGGKSNLIILRDKKVSNENKKINGFHEKFKVTIHSKENFDFSNVTQRNVVLIKKLIDKNSPETIIIPFNRSNSKKNRIISQSSILAGRNIKNILMYEKNENCSYLPTIFENTKNVYERKIEWLNCITKSKIFFAKDQENFNKKNKKYGINLKKFEPLQSQRLVLN